MGEESTRTADLADLDDKLTKEFDSIIELIDQTTDIFDDEAGGVKDLSKYVEWNIKKMEGNSEDEKGASKKALRKILLQRLDDPYLALDEVELVSSRLNISQKQVRDFLRNQRKRILFPLNHKLDRDFDAILKRNEELDAFIIQYLEEFCGQQSELPSSPIATVPKYMN
jgi:NADH:ubiquinone oxidoreductase subunit E